MHCISLAILSRLSRFPSPAIGTNWPFYVDVPLKHQSINHWINLVNHHDVFSCYLCKVNDWLLVVSGELSVSNKCDYVLLFGICFRPFIKCRQKVTTLPNALLLLCNGFFTNFNLMINRLELRSWQSPLGAPLIVLSNLNIFQIISFKEISLFLSLFSTCPRTYSFMYYLNMLLIIISDFVLHRVQRVLSDLYYLYYL